MKSSSFLTPCNDLTVLGPDVLLRPVLRSDQLVGEAGVHPPHQSGVLLKAPIKRSLVVPASVMFIVASTVCSDNEVQMRQYIH